jgi:virginiamycin B lyase
MKQRRTFRFLLALASPFGLSVLLPAINALPAQATSIADQPGGIKCSVSGLVRFSPPLTHSGGGSGRSPIKLSLAGCSVTEQGLTVPQGLLNGTLAQAPFSCATLSTTAPPVFSGRVRWPGSSNGVSQARTTMVAADSSHGSFDGVSTLALDVPSTFASACAGSPRGLRSVAVTGTINIGPACGPGTAPFSIYSIGGPPPCGLVYEPMGITTGPDGNLWFVNFNDSIGRVSPSTGQITVFKDPGIQGPSSITTGPDGALWFTNEYSRARTTYDSIGRITTTGAVTDYFDPSINGPLDITTGPDGALWFANGGNSNPGVGIRPSIGRITTSGVVTNFTDPSISEPMAITAGPDGALWFPNGIHTIGRMTTSGVVSNITDPRINGPADLTTGPDGALWFTQLFAGASSIGRITTTGAVSVFTAPGISAPYAITAGPDGAVWFTNYDDPGSIGRITMTGAVKAYPDPNLLATSDITSGPDGAVWFVSKGNDTVGRLPTP